MGRTWRSGRSRVSIQSLGFPHQLRDDVTSKIKTDKTKDLEAINRQQDIQRYWFLLESDLVNAIREGNLFLLT